VQATAATVKRRQARQGCDLAIEFSQLGQVGEHRQHRHQEFIAFLNSRTRRYPCRELHLICVNYGTHKHPEVRKWLAEHPRFHPHFTTTASWLNLIQRLFGIVSQQAIRRGSFDTVAGLERAITRFLEH